MFEEYRETRFAPPPLLKQMVQAGRLGKKSGRGFYDYGVRLGPAGGAAGRRGSVRAADRGAIGRGSRS